MRRRLLFGIALGGALAIGLSGCTVHPLGESAQRRAASRSGRPYLGKPDQRTLPPLPDNPTVQDLVRRAMLANAELEQKYWEWRAAIEQIPQDGTPDTTLALNAATSITRGRTGPADTVLTAQNMPSMMIPWPGKLSAAARRALENARAAGLRFRQAQFDLRQKVLDAWDNYALTAELIRLEDTNAQLLQTTAMVAEARNRAGAAGQQELLKARNALDLSRNDLASMRAQLPVERAALNALLDRGPDATLGIPTSLPERRAMTVDDAQLLALAAIQNPQLAALARQIAGQKEGIELARLQDYPDFMVGVSSDLAGITQTLAAMITVPLLRQQAIDAAIAQAWADLRATEAARRQTHNDLVARIVTDIRTLRDADRQLDLFEQTVLPRARQVVPLARAAYEAGQSSLPDLLDSQRSLISIERLVADLRITRDKRLADLESITAARIDSAARP